MKIILTVQGYTKFPNDKIEKVMNKNHQKNAFEQLLAYVYFENADQSKHGLILAGLITQ